ncbi:ABC transporter permease [Bosea sp. 124]|uniref:ABC transporter permease n=1 Tax=Bosea sp. 124 TaxID=2135642 RepID=UPI000D3B6675|nr:ABC transporter permease [Bosea sp. 124]PTM42741.1 putative spermidine/putrescine transport system permease protein [Bosea sp. 124]
MSARLKAVLLVLPLVAFLGLFFLWPLWMMVATSVQGGTVRLAFPETAAAIATWDGVSPPPAPLQAALLRDLRLDTPQERFGDAVRTLNSQQAGFRTLLPRTVRAVREAGEAEALDLAALDPRWSDQAYWLALKRSMPAYTDANLLAAVDLKRSDDGRIEPVPADFAVNRVIMLRTFVIAAQVTLLCGLIGLPFAMLAASVTGWKRNLLLVAVLLPLWTSLLVRTAAWLILLQDTGLINQTLRALGLIDGPLSLIYNRTGVLIAMTHVLLPLMVLPIYASLIAIPRNLMPAAAALGAAPLQAFRHVLLPLAMPGLLSGSLLVFMVALGYYITPALTGGAGDQMISSVIAFYATGTANWGMAGALGLFLLVPTTVLYIVYGRLSRTPLVQT